jgi:NDP-sugar pyrophosphorylase family protein
MNAMLLGAGRGTRLGSLGLHVPKVLVDIAGEPLLARQLRYLEREGVKRVVINAHHLSAAIETFAGEYKGGLDLVVVVEAELLGTAGGVRNAREFLGDDLVIVLYGDVLTRQPLRPIVDFHREKGFAATLTIYESDYVEGKGTVAVCDDGSVTAFAEKETRRGGGSAWINAGLYVLSPGLIDLIPGDGPSDFGHDTFPSALEAGKRIGGYRLAEPVIDVGTPEGLAEARRMTAAEAADANPRPPSR